MSMGIINSLGISRIEILQIISINFSIIFSTYILELLLQKYGANKQKLLWASTSVKNPEYEELLYVKKLIGPETVNTVPQNVYEGIISNINHYEDLLNSDNKYHEQLIATTLNEKDLKSITDELLIDGIRLFEEAFDSLIDEIKNKISEHS